MAVEVSPGFHRVIGQRQRTRGSLVLTTERFSTRCVQPGESAAEPSLRPRTDAKMAGTGVDPLENKEGRLITERQNLWNPQSTGRPQPGEPRGLSTEEPRGRVRVGLYENAASIGQIRPERSGEVATVHVVGSHDRGAQRSFHQFSDVRVHMETVARSRGSGGYVPLPVTRPTREWSARMCQVGLALFTLSPMPLKPGPSATTTLVVTDDDTAIRLRTGDVPVLATPRVIALLEEAAAIAVHPLLDEGTTTVAVRVQVEHISPTAVGDSVTAEATLEKVEGRRLTFQVTARDRRGLVAAGKVTRVLVNVEQFLDKTR